MNFIKKIYDKNIDEEVHMQFMKFSRGEFKSRALIQARQSKGKYTIVTSQEFANGLVREVAKKLGGQRTLVQGAIVSTSNLTEEIDFYEKKQFQGVKKYLIKKEFTGDEIIELIEKFPKSFFALSFSTEKDDTVLKIKPKAPKSGKPKSKGDQKPKPNFCRLITKDEALAKSFIFEKKDWKRAEVEHAFMIKDIVLPDGEEDPAKVRELAKRKGVIIREAMIDEENVRTDIEFEV